jgi:hypothetical protein
MIALKADISHIVKALEDSFFLLTVIVNNSSQERPLSTEIWI